MAPQPVYVLADQPMPTQNVGYIVAGQQMPPQAVYVLPPQPMPTQNGGYVVAAQSDQQQM